MSYKHYTVFFTRRLSLDNSARNLMTPLPTIHTRYDLKYYSMTHNLYTLFFCVRSSSYNALHIKWALYYLVSNRGGFQRYLPCNIYSQWSVLENKVTCTTEIFLGKFTCTEQILHASVTCNPPPLNRALFIQSVQGMGETLVSAKWDKWQKFKHLNNYQ